MGLFDKFGGKKKEAFYDEYAGTHGFERSTRPIPAVTKNLEGRIVTNERFDGRLSTEYKGTVALIETTITTSVPMVTTDRDSSINTWLPEGTETIGTETNSNTYPSTVIQIPLDKLTGTVSGLAVKRNFNKQSMGKNDMYGDLRRISLDGTDLDPEYFVFVDEQADPEKVRQLFTSSMSAWLNEREGKFFGFEFGQGTLVTKHGGKPPKDAEKLDAQVAEACELAGQLGE